MNLYEYKGMDLEALNKEEILHYFGLSTTSKNLKEIIRIEHLPSPKKPVVKKESMSQRIAVLEGALDLVCQGDDDVAFYIAEAKKCAE